MLLDLLPADDERLLLALGVDVQHAHIRLGRDTGKRAQRLHDLAVLDLVIAFHALRRLKPARGVDNDGRTRLDGNAAGIEVIILPVIFEFDTDYFCQWLFLNSVSSSPGPHGRESSPKICFKPTFAFRYS